ncbi:hypothetical protein ACFS07_10080 [Undibacterium arcticum]
MSKSIATPGTDLMAATDPSVAPLVVRDMQVPGAAQATLAARLYSTSTSPSAATVADSLIVFFSPGRLCWRQPGRVG